MVTIIIVIIILTVIAIVLVCISKIISIGNSMMMVIIILVIGNWTINRNRVSKTSGVFLKSDSENVHLISDLANDSS